MEVRLKSAQFKFGYLNECELDAHCGLAAYACFAAMLTYVWLISHPPRQT